MKKILILWSFIVLSALAPKAAQAYPNYIGHGYNSCLTCHFNPFGNGPLNDYGRAFSATAISSRGFYDDNKSEELIGQESGFFFRQPTNNNIRTQANYRGLLLKRNFREPSEATEYINMQADFNLILKGGVNDKFISNFSFGYAPIPRSQKNSPSASTIKEYRSREHYIGFRPSSTWGIYAGLMDKTFGIRISEHTAYSRSTPRLTMDDQSHGVTIHYNNPMFEGGVNYYVGNLAQDEALRMKGVASTFEFTVFDKNRLGLSVLKEGNQYLDQLAYAAHVRMGFDHGTSLMVEIGKISKTAKLVADTKTEMYGYFANHLQIKRGIYFLNSIEYYKNVVDNSYRVRFGPSIQYFPVSKMEFRLDLNNTRSFSEQTSVKDRWDLMAQIHLWL